MTAAHVIPAGRMKENATNAPVYIRYKQLGFETIYVEAGPAFSWINPAYILVLLRSSGTDSRTNQVVIVLPSTFRKFGFTPYRLGSSKT